MLRGHPREDSQQEGLKQFEVQNRDQGIERYTWVLLPLIQAWSGWHFPGTICKVVKKKGDLGWDLEEECQHVRHAQKNRIIPKRLRNGQRR